MPTITNRNNLSQKALLKHPKVLCPKTIEVKAIIKILIFLLPKVSSQDRKAILSMYSLKLSQRIERIPLPVNPIKN